MVGAEGVAQEAYHVFDVVVVVVAAVEEVEVGEGLELCVDEHTGYDLLPCGGIVLAAVGHDVVDVFDEDDFAVEVVEVLYQRTVASGTEEETAVVIAEGGIVHIGCDGVGRWFLLGEGDVILDAVLLFVLGELVGYELLEEGAVLGADGKVYVGFAL